MPAFASTMPLRCATTSTPLRCRTTSVDFAKDQFDQPRVLVHLGGELFRARRRRHLAEIDDAAFGLRHDLLRDHQDVAAPERKAGCGEPVEDQVGDIVALLDQRNARQRRDADFGGRAGLRLWRRARHRLPPPEGR